MEVVFLSLPEYRVYAPSRHVLARLPGGDMGRLSRSRLWWLLADIGRMGYLLGSNEYVYAAEAVLNSGVGGEWLARAALLLGLAGRVVSDSIMVQPSRLAVYRSSIVPRLANVLDGMGFHSYGAAIIVANMVCPRSPVHDVAAVLLALAGPRTALGRYAFEISRRRMEWLCSFQPCNTLGGSNAEHSLQPLSKAEGLMRVHYTLDTRLYAATLAAAAGIAVPHTDGKLAVLGKGPAWAVEYPKLLYGEDSPALVAEAMRRAASGGLEKALGLLAHSGNELFAAAAEAARIVCMHGNWGGATCL